MRPALFYISDAAVRGRPSARETEALRQARLAEVRSLIAEIAAEQPRFERRPSRNAASCCRRELLVA